MDRYGRDQAWSSYFEIGLKRFGDPVSAGDDAKTFADRAMEAMLRHETEEDESEQKDVRRLVVDAVRRTGGPLTRDELEARVKGEWRKRCGEWEPRRFRDALFVLLEKQEIAVEVGKDGIARFDLDIPF